ncbi:LRR receptor-like serine/threonine-protein kinase ERL2 [Striga hermonthica]|uniref:LRR receptor-like serine/threonine-protein kinase ERL2 n=1 Tax=Striga hermonthica TaxID=68872 RepID=A0A9N7MYS8_STRHE|nr:LRR receptor-like serine/threonine-protein kinase ERL2 [Striga hermonthica]
MLNLVGLYVSRIGFLGLWITLLTNSMTWKIETFNLSCNFFYGNLPRSLGNLSYLTYFYLHGKKFTGEIPSEIGNFMQLQYLDVSENELVGHIPAIQCTMENLFYLNWAGYRP